MTDSQWSLRCCAEQSACSQESDVKQVALSLSLCTGRTYAASVSGVRTPQRSNSKNEKQQNQNEFKSKVKLRCRRRHRHRRLLRRLHTHNVFNALLSTIINLMQLRDARA